ncbi:hypothetical protein KC335_g3273 [Hortaea werneckii]|nr:hypothetical protein KC350_g9965 [Hortaea werneckii]KAI6827693.1 hypothetical protein KC358_g7421 [Hortaea werneckii]KAI6833837.1 hypothetical protein KC342_g6566 [Hortaea werneckii]KAI6929679.1 hypothetical protein KC348_g7788 [Hortaea werneckii]KAI6973038.1 hypothetical protein KC329_g12430 [Hortaea werneckii]
MLQLIQEKLRGLLGRLRRQPVPPPSSPVPQEDEETPLIPKPQGIAEADTTGGSMTKSLQQAGDKASRLWHELPALPRR